MEEAAAEGTDGNEKQSPSPLSKKMKKKLAKEEAKQSKLEK